jgi:preprotein translocase SecE subunit
MGFGLHKPGQGYWVRVLTATMAGVIVLAAAAWLWQELQRASAAIPTPTWTIVMDRGTTGKAEAGQVVTLLGEPGATGAREEIGTATVKVFDATGNGRVTIGDRQMKAGKDPSGIRALAPGPAGGATLNGPVSGNPVGVPLFDALYLQAAGVSLVLILGAFLVYWMVGVNARTVEFLIATDGEMKKVNWSSRKDIVGSTWVVILWSVLLAGGLWVVDFLFQAFFKVIGVLQS